MTLEEAKTELPWLTFSRTSSFAVDIQCTVCKGLETFSLLMLRDSLGGDVLRVKAVRFHLYCGQQIQKKYQLPASKRTTVNVTPVRAISLTDE